MTGLGLCVRAGLGPRRTPGRRRAASSISATISDDFEAFVIKGSDVSRCSPGNREDATPGLKAAPPRGRR